MSTYVDDRTRSLSGLLASRSSCAGCSSSSRSGTRSRASCSGSAGLDDDAVAELACSCEADEALATGAGCASGELSLDLLGADSSGGLKEMTVRYNLATDE